MIKTFSLLFSALLLSGCASETQTPSPEQAADQQAETNQLIDDLLEEHEENTDYAPSEDRHIAHTQIELTKELDGVYFAQEALFNRDTYAFELHLSDSLKADIDENGLTLAYLFDIRSQARYLSKFVQETSYDPDLNVAVVDPLDATRDYLFLVRDGEVVESILDDIEIAD